jgi:hypothetical protein
VPQTAQILDNSRFQRESSVVGSDRDAHGAFILPMGRPENRCNLSVFFCTINIPAFCGLFAHGARGLANVEAFSN